MELNLSYPWTGVSLVNSETFLLDPRVMAALEVALPGATPEEIEAAVEAYLLANPVITTWGTVVGSIVDQLDLQAALDGKQPAGSYAALVHTHTIANVTDLQAELDAKAPTASPTFTGTVSGVTKTHVGLGNVDNTSDANKPVSTAQQTALNLKQDISTLAEAIRDTVAATLVAGANVTVTVDDALDTITIAASGGGGGAVDSVNGETGVVVLNQDEVLDGTTFKQFSQTEKTKLSGVATGATANSTDAFLLARSNHTGSQAQSTVTNLTTDLAAKAPLASPAFTGTPTGITKTHVGLGNVDNTADTAKPVSTAQQTALNLKANLASPTFTGTVAGITKTMVGLSNVDNTADTAKPVSSAQQAALDTKLEASDIAGKVDGLNGATGIWVGTEAELPAEPRDPTVAYFVIP